MGGGPSPQGGAAPHTAAGPPALARPGPRFFRIEDCKQQHELTRETEDESQRSEMKSWQERDAVYFVVCEESIIDTNSELSRKNKK